MDAAVGRDLYLDSDILMAIVRRDTAQRRLTRETIESCQIVGGIIEKALECCDGVGFDGGKIQQHCTEQCLERLVECIRVCVVNLHSVILRSIKRGDFLGMRHESHIRLSVPSWPEELIVGLCSSQKIHAVA